MILYRCDRCGAEQNTRTPFLVGRVIDTFGTTMAELCEGCLHALTEWMKVTSDV